MDTLESILEAAGRGYVGERGEKAERQRAAVGELGAGRGELSALRPQGHEFGVIVARGGASVSEEIARPEHAQERGAFGAERVALRGEGGHRVEAGGLIGLEYIARAAPDGAS